MSFYVIDCFINNCNECNDCNDTVALYINNDIESSTIKEPTNSCAYIFDVVKLYPNDKMTIRYVKNGEIISENNYKLKVYKL